MKSAAEIGLDSQCLSYLLDAFEGVGPPTGDLAEQKLALVRLFLYTPGTLWITPTVEREFLRIRDPKRRSNHVSWTNVHFGVRPISDPDAVRRRALHLADLHPDEDDCLVLAEAEQIGLSTLLSFDFDFVRRLSPGTELALTRPAHFWESLAVAKDSRPDKVPAAGNPLGQQTWWRW
jgi:hypothetical protein